MTSSRTSARRRKLGRSSIRAPSCVELDEEPRQAGRPITAPVRLACPSPHVESTLDTRQLDGELDPLAGLELPRPLVAGAEGPGGGPAAPQLPVILLRIFRPGRRV